MRMTSAIAFFVVCLLPALVAAQYPSVHTPTAVEKAPRGSVAVVVAIQDYLLLPDVDGAVTTANDWETFFRNSLGVDAVRVLVNHDASREEIASFAKRAAEDVGENADLWFVFIGHGAPGEDDGVIVGVDAQQTTSSLTARSLPQRELLSTLEAGKQARTLVVIDACFSGRTSSGAALAKGAQPVVAVPKPKIDKRTVVMTAAQSKEFAGALPGAARPAFSYLLLGAMRGWADDGDGMVTADEAVAWTRMRLRGVSGRAQTPQIQGELDFTLTRGATDRDPGLDRLLAGAGVSEPSRPAPTVEPDGECSGGQVRNADTGGHCCWPGQAWNGAECVGLPSKCPDGAQVDRAAEACVYPECAVGKVRARDGVHCCWPRQAWSSTKKMCIGAPACPPGTAVRGEACIGDRDSDGIPDDADTCPDQPEDFDNVVDDDGCPDDNDADGVPDAEDKCPDAAEDADDFAVDGCPDPDNDEDGIEDERDQCPNEAEDKDGIADTDGCPEVDFDADGLADTDDRCPLEPEDLDGVQDDDGCPESANGSLLASYVLGGTGLAIVGLSAIPLVSAGSLRTSTRAAIADGTVTQAAVVDNEQRANTQATFGALLGGVGGSLLVIGIASWFLDADSPVRGGSVAVGVSADNRPRVTFEWRW